MNRGDFRWAINWDGDESAAVRCYSESCWEHGEHYGTFSEVKRIIVRFHKSKAEDHRDAARTWRKAKAGDWE